MAGTYYGVLWESFWTGRTGRELRRAGGKDAQILAAYLVSNRHANMLGLYRLSADDIQHETGLKRREIEKALQVLDEVGFATYDAGTEHVWVLTMARFRLGLKAGEALGANDKRVVGVNKLYHGIDGNPFLADYFQANGAGLRLTKAREATGTRQPLASSMEGASKGLRSGQVESGPQDTVHPKGLASPLEGASKGLPSQVSGSGTRSQDQDSGTRSQEQESAGRGATFRPQPVENDGVNVNVVTRIAHEVLDDEGDDATVADLADALKSRCARLRVSLTPDAVTKAIDSALAQRRRRQA